MNAPTAPHSLHAVYSPSSGKRWAKEGGCTASAEAIAHLPAQEENEAAAKGTAAHEELERCLGPLNGEMVDPATMHIEPVDPDHPSAESVALMIAYVRKLPPGRMWVEQRVALTDQIWGRADVQHWHEESATLTVPDLKDGFVGVDPDSEQIWIYGAASIRTNNLPAKWFRSVIVQPNDFRPVDRVKQLLVPADELAKFAERVSKIPTSPKVFKAGEGCTYCPLFGRCEASRDVLANMTALVVGLMTPAQVPLEQRALFKACEKPIKDAFANADKAWLKDEMVGNHAPGLTIVETVKHRAWISESAARAAVIAQKGVDALKPPTPAQAEAMGINIEGLADKPEGGPVLAFESDKRKPWAPKTASSMFQGIPGLAK